MDLSLIAQHLPTIAKNHQKLSVSERDEDRSRAVAQYCKRLARTCPEGWFSAYTTDDCGWFIIGNRYTIRRVDSWSAEGHVLAALLNRIGADPKAPCRIIPARNGTYELDATPNAAPSYQSLNRIMTDDAPRVEAADVSVLRFGNEVLIQRIVATTADGRRNSFTPAILAWAMQDAERLMLGGRRPAQCIGADGTITGVIMPTRDIPFDEWEHAAA